MQSGDLPVQSTFFVLSSTLGLRAPIVCFYSHCKVVKSFLIFPNRNTVFHGFLEGLDCVLLKMKTNGNLKTNVTLNCNLLKMLMHKPLPFLILQMNKRHDPIAVSSKLVWTVWKSI